MENLVRRVLVNGMVIVTASHSIIRLAFLLFNSVGPRRDYGAANVSSSRNSYGRKLPPTPKQPSMLQLPFQSNINFPKLETSPSSVCENVYCNEIKTFISFQSIFQLLGAQPILQMLPDSLNRNNLHFQSNQHLKYEDIERELYERERDVDSECGIKSPRDKRWGQGPLSFEEALLLSRPIRSSSSVVWDGLKTTVVGYSAQSSVFDDDGWC